MATLPLFDPLAPAPSAHRVRAPGGYESWRVVAHDPTSGMWIIATFHLGFPCRAYIRRYFAFRSRPTRRAPPLPVEYPALTVFVYAGDRVTASTTRVNPSDFVTDGNGIRVGPHELTREADGEIRLRANCLNMRLHPRFTGTPVQHSLSGSAGAGLTHQWLLADGVCQVNGTIDLDSRSTAFTGMGIHDQQFGTVPMLAHWLRGYVFLADRAIAFQQIDQMHIARIGPDLIMVEADPAAAVSRSRTRWGIAYPRVIALSGGAILEDPRVVHSTPTMARIFYRAAMGSEQGAALCEIADARRLDWPGRLLAGGD